MITSDDGHLMEGQCLQQMYQVAGQTFALIQKEVFVLPLTHYMI